MDGSKLRSYHSRLTQTAELLAAAGRVSPASVQTQGDVQAIVGYLDEVKRQVTAAQQELLTLGEDLPDAKQSQLTPAEKVRIKQHTRKRPARRPDQASNHDETSTEPPVANVLDDDEKQVPESR
jgi:hypothetical protein